MKMTSLTISLLMLSLIAACGEDSEGQTTTESSLSSTNTAICVTRKQKWPAVLGVEVRYVQTRNECNWCVRHCVSYLESYPNHVCRVEWLR